MLLIIRNTIFGLASNLLSVPAPATLQDMTDQKLAGTAVTLITADTCTGKVGDKNWQKTTKNDKKAPIFFDISTVQRCFCQLRQKSTKIDKKFTQA